VILFHGLGHVDDVDLSVVVEEVVLAQVGVDEAADFKHAADEEEEFRVEALELVLVDVGVL
jgi:hypothetical protein